MTVPEKVLKYIDGQLYEYELYDLVDQYDTVLTQKLDPFYFEGPNKTPVIARNLAVSLLETMKKYNGIGLSANQVGIPLRVFVVGLEKTWYAFFNPEILETSGEILFAEGCLSFPGLFIPIKRPDTVKIKYQDMNGEFKEQTFTGLTARIVLHEYDHMEGIVFTSKVPRLILDKAKSKITKNLKKLKEQRIAQEKQDLIMEAMTNLVKQGEKIKANQVLTVTP